MAIKFPRKELPTPHENSRILMEECHRASRLHHDNIVQTVVAIGNRLTLESWPRSPAEVSEVQGCHPGLRSVALPHPTLPQHVGCQRGRHHDGPAHESYDIPRRFLQPSEFSGCLHTLLLMVEILHYLKDPKLWEFWHIPYSGVLQDFISSTVPPETSSPAGGCRQLSIGISD